MAINSGNMTSDGCSREASGVGGADLARRPVLSIGGMALAGLLLGGCSGSTKARGIPITVYRDPNCDCCEKWASIADQSGFAATVIDSTDMSGVKQKLGVPATLGACHTAIVRDYVVEGHVPLDAVHRLLRDKPKNIRGIAVPGMPAGSPGMDTLDESKEPFQILAFDATGAAAPF